MLFMVPRGCRDAEGRVMSAPLDPLSDSFSSLDIYKIIQFGGRVIEGLTLSKKRGPALCS